MDFRATKDSFRIKRLFIRVPTFLLLWWVLTGGEKDSWTIGLPTVTVATLLSLASSDSSQVRWSPLGVASFIPFFLWYSLRGGLDVAFQALRPRLSLDPALVYHPLRLPDGPARIFLANTVNLLPGTLSAEVQGGQLTIHMLDASLPAIRDLHLMEERTAALYGLSLSP